METFLRIVVTGTTGFVGRHLVSWLSNRGYDLVRIDRSTGWPVTADEWSERLSGADVVLHLAGIAHVAGSSEQYAQLLESMRDLIVAARRVGVRQFIYMSSIAAQTDAFSERTISETSDSKPVSAYGVAKLQCEALLIAGGVPYTILRPVAIMGPGAKGNPGLLQKLARSGVPLPIAAITARRAVMSITQLNEAIGIVLLNVSALNEVFVVADVAKTIGELVGELRTRVGKPRRIFKFPPSLLMVFFTAIGQRAAWRRMSEPLIVDSSKLRRLGWLGGK